MLATVLSAVALVAANAAPIAQNSFEEVSWRQNVPLVFDATPSIDPDGRIVRYEWDLDGDGTFEQSGAGLTKPTQTYAQPGFVVAQLRVTDDAGATAVAQIEVMIGETDTVRILSAPSTVTRRQLLAGIHVVAERNNAGYGRIIHINVMCGKGRKARSIAAGFVETPAGPGFMRGDITVRSTSRFGLAKRLTRLRKPARCSYRVSSNGAKASRPVLVKP